MILKKCDDVSMNFSENFSYEYSKLGSSVSSWIHHDRKWYSYPKYDSLMYNEIDVCIQKKIF